MAMRSLRDRLSHMQSQSAIRGSSSALEKSPVIDSKAWTAPTRYHTLASAIQGRIHTRDAGAFCSRMLIREDAPMQSSRDAFLFQSTLRIHAVDQLQIRPQEENASGIDLDRIAFVDTETTGLGGSGAVPFVIGIGWYQKNQFTVEQYLLPDYADEAAMLEQVLADLQRAEAVVTYNGAAFDIPLLRDRLVIHRIIRDYQPKVHLDLLHLSRRVFKRRLRDCSLGNLESTVLGHERLDDVPGYLIPATYFEWLNSENPKPLIGVLDHNADDIISLAALFQYLAQAVGSSGESLERSDDMFGLSRHFRRRKDLLQEFRALEIICQERSVDERAPEMALAFAQRLRKSASEDEQAQAISLLQEIASEGNTTALEALQQLAIHAERELRDPKAALRLTEQGISLLARLKGENVAVRQSVEQRLLNRRTRLVLKSQNSR